MLAGVSAVAIGFVGAGVAGAATTCVSKDFTYRCNLPILGATPFAVTVAADVPDSVTAGDPLHLGKFQTTVETPANVTSVLTAFGVANVEGTAQVTNEITDNGVTQESTFTATVPKTAVPATGTLVTVASATVPDYTTTAAGSVVLGSGPFTVQLHGTKADGITDAGQDSLLTFTCTPPADATLATVTVTEPAPTTSSSAPTDTSTPTADTSTPPTDTSTPPADTSTSPADTSTPPADTSTPPADSSTSPGATGAGGSVTPVGSGDTSSGDVAAATSSVPAVAGGASSDTTPDASPASNDSSLAFTGTQSALLTVLGALLVIGGVIALLIARRRPGRRMS